MKCSILNERLAELALTGLTVKQALELGHWLAGNESLGAKIEMTGFGRQAARVGRAVKSKGFLIYNITLTAAGVAILCSRSGLLPEAVLPLASAAQSSVVVLFIGAVGVISSVKAGSIAIRDRHSFTDALSQGRGVFGAFNIYAKHLVAELQARLPNPHVASEFWLGIGAWMAEKTGLAQASARLKQKALGVHPRVDAFKIWKEEAALKARFMLNREQRSLDVYRSAVRFVLALRWGHFELCENAPKLDEGSSDLRHALAASFEAAFPSKPGRGCLPNNRKSRNYNYVSYVDERQAVRKLLAGANNSDADPLYAPRVDMPRLADLLGLAMASLSVSEAWSLDKFFAPWRAALESQAIRGSMESEIERVDKGPSPDRKSRRL